MQLALYTLVPLGLLAIIILFYFLIRAKMKQDQILAMLLAEDDEKNSPKEERSGESGSTGTSKAKDPTEENKQEVKKFWKIESQKEQSRHSLFSMFSRIPVLNTKQDDAPKKTIVKPAPKLTAKLKTKHYKIKNLQKLSKKPEQDINIHLEKIKAMQAESPFSKVRKLSKKGKQEYIDMLKQQEDKKAYKHILKDFQAKKKKSKQPRKQDPIKKLDSMLDKKKKIINRLRKI